MNAFDITVSRYDSTFHIEQVCFERIFDAPGRSGHFSFEAGGKRQYGVILHGGSVPREGDRVAVALAEPGNWQTIRAWRDLATPDVHLYETVGDVMLGYAWFGYFSLPVVAGVTWLAFGPWAALLAVALLLWAGAAYLRRVARRNRRMDQALRDLDPPAPPAGGKRRPAWLARLGWAWFGSAS